MVAQELESSLEEERGAGERSASYVVSPFGARMNRVLIAGTLSPAEPIGRDPAQPFWRSRLSDPTGAVAVTAGSFQPRAMDQLRSSSAPRSAIVVGKVNLYKGRDGTAYLSVRAEAVRTVGETEERAALADAVRQTLDRLDLIERLSQHPALSPETLASHGVPRFWVVAARESIRRYPTADRARFRGELRAAVRRIAGVALPADAPEVPPTVQIRRDPPPSAPPPPSAAERAEESLVLEFLDQVAEASLDAYADRRELLARVGSRGLGPDRAELVLTRLEDEGVVEEPIVGKLRRA
ncbi:MAG: hypothetical protein L3K02_00525 [Thermoplasmata archaeon]|nr:hypothetical protein [Thermoplasmata archaeon]